jgi:hypothetical protein
MHTFDGSLLFTLCGAVLLTIGTAMAAEPSPPIRLRIPFENAFAPDGLAATQSYRHGNCRVSGEQALRIERDTSNPCLAADSGGACFYRLGLGALQSQRALLPHDGGRRCVD